jgi:hypothetical protein
MTIGFQSGQLKLLSAAKMVELLSSFNIFENGYGDDH